MLEGRGAILNVARDVSQALSHAGIEAAVIGGVAVVLHGYVRTTVDVDLLIPEVLPSLKGVLEKAGCSFHRSRSEFRKQGVPVHLVTLQQTRTMPAGFVEIEGIRTVSLPDLIGMKLSSGLRDPLRAIDLADVIGLIRHHRLAPTFASQLPKALRAEFRKLARAIAKERS